MVGALQVFINAEWISNSQWKLISLKQEENTDTLYNMDQPNTVSNKPFTK